MAGLRVAVEQEHRIAFAGDQIVKTHAVDIGDALSDAVFQEHSHQRLHEVLGDLLGVAEHHHRCPREGSLSLYRGVGVVADTAIVVTTLRVSSGPVARDEPSSIMSRVCSAVGPGDARRATNVIDAVLAHGLQCGIDGGLGIDAQLRVRGRSVTARLLNDIDLVVSDFESIPTSLADALLLNHDHPFAPEGKTLLQVIDQPRALRVDLFRAFGDTSREPSCLTKTPAGFPSCPRGFSCANDSDGMRHPSARDNHRFQARRGVPEIEGIGEPRRLAVAWLDHRQDVQGTIEEAAEKAARLLSVRPELIVVERYSIPSLHRANAV